MSGPWKLFFFLRFPIAVLVVLLAVQAAAYGLRTVPLRRQQSDELPTAIEAEHSRHRIVLFGDSVIRSATRNYNVGSEADVLNLSTHILIGLGGDVLMLRRYLRTHPAPDYVMIVGAPSLYTMAQDDQKLHYYLWNVFRRDDERAFLEKLYPGINRRGWMPAIMDLQQRVVEPLLSLARRSPAKYYTVGQDPDPSAPREPDSTNAASRETIVGRFSEPVDTILPAQSMALQELCNLSRDHGFRVNFVWTAAPRDLVASWKERDILPKLQDQITKAMNTGCPAASFTNVNDTVAYTVFDHVGAHLRGSGWEQVFTGQVKQHIADLLAQKKDASIPAD